MSRLVTPMSEEEFKKLPKWQQWLSQQWYIVPVLATILILIVCMIFAWFGW